MKIEIDLVKSLFPSLLNFTLKKIKSNGSIFLIDSTVCFKVIIKTIHSEFRRKYLAVFYIRRFSICVFSYEHPHLHIQESQKNRGRDETNTAFKVMVLNNVFFFLQTIFFFLYFPKFPPWILYCNKEESVKMPLRIQMSTISSLATF